MWGRRALERRGRETSGSLEQRKRPVTWVGRRPPRPGPGRPKGVYYVRISKSMIANLRKVRNVSAEPGGRMVAVLLNDERVIISRSYVKEIKRRLGIQ